MDLDLTPRETELMTRLLEYRLGGLRREINHTDSRAFKAGLKADEALIEGILARLKAPAAMGM